MSWKSTKTILGAENNRRGLQPSIMAGLVCNEAEKRYPSLFRAISLRRGVLHLEISKKNQLELRLIEGKLLEELGVFAKERNLPLPTRIRLTFTS